jgi:hypothetical protein
MTELTLNLDHEANQAISDLMSEFGVRTSAEVITKAINALRVISYVNRTNGKLYARKGTHETELIIR